MGLLNPLYAAAHIINQRLKTTRKAPIPVICIGNAVAGGSGKTPVALALMGHLKQIWPDTKCAFLTRGYGGRISDPTLVDRQFHTALDCGDEALLLSAAAPCIVSRNRYEGALMAHNAGYNLVIMDDGLQHAGLHKDISLMVIDGAAGFGNGKTLPAGPLRENLDSAFSKTDAFVIVGTDRRNTKAILSPGKPVFEGKIEINPDTLPDKSKPLVAFAGLGRPEKFYALLMDLGYTIAHWQAFADHHVYTKAELEQLLAIAKEKNATLITTEKDYVRIDDEKLRRHIQTLPIQVKFVDEPFFLTFLQNAIPA